MRQQSLENIRAEIEQDLGEFGVEFDRWYSEQSLEKNGLIDAALEVEGLGTLRVDTAFGGDSFVIVDAAGLGFSIAPDEARDLARLGVPMYTISRVLGHAQGGVTEIYARHGFLREKREALDAWADRLAVILADREAKVVNFR